MTKTTAQSEPTALLRCRLGWHPWPAWGNPYSTTVSTWVWGEVVKQGQPAVLQSRRCPGCGKAESLILKTRQG